MSNERKHKIFLGGTCNGTTWRDELISMLDKDIQYFNPVVEDWTPECQVIERIEKEERCDIHLYVITSQMKGVFSIAEAMDSVHNKGKQTIFVVLRDGFDEWSIKSLEAVVDLITIRGGTAWIGCSLSALAYVIKSQVRQ